MSEIKKLTNATLIEKLLTAFLLAMILARLLFSWTTLPTFPPFYGDELENCLDAQTFLTDHDTSYPLTRHVIDPRYYDIAAQSQNTLRGVYFTILGALQKLAHGDYLRNRQISFAIFLITGFLLFVLTRKMLGLLTALLTSVLWTGAGDVNLASHLVRPDIMLGLFLIGGVTVIVVSKGRWAGLGLFFSGVIAGLGPGLHAHGLLLLPLFYLMFFIRGNQTSKLSGAVFITVGALAGLIGSILLADISGFYLSQFSLQTMIFADRTAVWQERLSPFTHLADSILSFIRPSTYYINDSLRHLVFWPLLGAATLLSYGYSFIWLLSAEKKNRADNIFLAGFIYVFFAIGFGHLKEEYIYNLPTTLFACPMVAAAMVASVTQVKDFFALTSRQKWPALGVAGFFIAASLALALVVGHKSPLFLLLLALVPLSLERAKSWKIGVVGGAGLLILLALWIRDKSFMKLLDQQSHQFIFSTMGISLGLAATGCLGLAVFILKREKFSGLWLQPYISSLVKLTSLTAFLLTAIISFMVHEVTLSRRNVSLETTLDQVEAVVGPGRSIILGPDVLWFRFRDRLRGLGGLTGEYYYSGKWRPADSIRRAHPAILIIDQEFAHRFLAEAQNASAEEQRLLSKMLSIPVRYKGRVPGTLNISTVDIFDLDWEAGSRR